MKNIVISTNKENPELVEQVSKFVNNSDNIDIKSKKKLHLELSVANDDPSVYEFIAEAVSNFIIEFVEKDIVKELVETEFFGSEDSLIGDAVKVTQKMIFDSKEKIDERKILQNEVLEIIKSSNEFNLAGYLQFRFKDRYLKLVNIVYEEIENIFEEKDIEDFVNIVKKLIRLQPPKMEHIHIVSISEDEYKIITSDLDTIAMDELKQTLEETNVGSSGYKITSTDLILSSLLTLLPKHVYIHSNGEYNHQAFMTVEKIYEGRTKRCSSCEFCDSVKNIDEAMEEEEKD